MSSNDRSTGGYRLVAILQTVLLMALILGPALSFASDPSGDPGGTPPASSEPSAEPTVDPGLEPTPEPVPSVEPTPEPDPSTDPSPSTEPDPTAAPDPSEAPTPAPEPGATPEPATEPFIVTFAPGVTSAEQDAVLAGVDAVETGSVPQLRMRSILLRASTVSQNLIALGDDPRVLRVDTDRVRSTDSEPNDASYSGQWSLPRIGWDQAYGVVDPAGSAVVAVLDTGVDASHPDLDDVIVSGASFVAGSSWNSDPNGHGTSMAGIVAAETGNGIGIAGVGYDGVSIMPVTVLGSDGIGQDSDIISGVVWAADQGADVILMAFSATGYSAALQAAIDYAWSQGSVLVAAVGNDGSSSVTFPAGDRGVVGVSSTNSADELAPGSNSGEAVFLAAPGEAIVTTTPAGGYGPISGTSAAAAHVAGAAALLAASDSSASNGVIVGRLARTADLAGTVAETGNGRLNVGRAIADTDTGSVQPAGAAPVGSGGPFVGPYVVAATSVSAATIATRDAACATAQSTFGSGTTVCARVIVTATGGGGGAGDFYIRWEDPTSILQQNTVKTVAIATFTDTYVPTTVGTWTVKVCNSVACTGGNLVASSTFTVTAAKANQTITFGALGARTYGDAPFALSATASSGLAVSFSSTTSGVCTVAGTTVTIVAAGTCTIAADQAGDASYNAAPQVLQGFTVSKAILTVTADNKARAYGDANPAFTASYTGFKNGETLGTSGVTGSPSLTTTAVATSPVSGSPYMITAAPGDLAAGNYSFTFVNGTLSITARAITVTADAQSKTYGDADPALTFTTSSLGTGIAVAGALTRDPGETVAGGPYAITQGTVTNANNPNYTITFVGANLSITAKPVTITPNSGQSKVLGAADPTLTYAYSALAAGDTASVFGGALGRAAGESVGSYAINLGTLSAGSNYTLNLSSPTVNFAIRYSTGSCLGSPGHQVLQPINADGTSVFKKGSTIPVKFRVCDAFGNSIGAPAAVVSSFQLIGKYSGLLPETVVETIVSTTPDTAFRWSSSDQQWIFNLNTKNLSASFTYRYLITLNDTSTIEFLFGMK